MWITRPQVSGFDDQQGISLKKSYVENLWITMWINCG